MIITFYSYKGGVGRSMALANIATILSHAKKKVLIVDWDLEAPGIENYFIKFIEENSLCKKDGIVEIVNNYTSNQTCNWRDAINKISIGEYNSFKYEIDIITAGKKDNNYYQAVRSIDFKKVFEKNNGIHLIDKLRTEWQEEYDFVLIDSRTGITDIGGICTIYFPDVVLLFLTATEQSLNGVLEVGSKINDNVSKLPIERYNVITLPIPSRFDTITEFQLGQTWLTKFAKKLFPLVEKWSKIESEIEFRSLLEVIKTPYSSYFSYGEKLAVLEQGIKDPSSLGYSYALIATLILNKFENFGADFEYSLLQTIENTSNSLYASSKSTSITRRYPVTHLNFIGRSIELEKVSDKLEKNQFLLINGEGGIGKTCLAAEFLNLNQSKYPYHGWLFCGAGIMEALKDLALELKLDQQDYSKEEAFIQAIIYELAQRPGGLLVLDNATSPEELEWFHQAFGGLRQWRFLLTSRCQQVWDAAEEYLLHPLAPEDAERLFKTYYDEGTETFNRILKRLLPAIGYNTLLIELFSKNQQELAGLDETLEDFLEELEERGLFLGERSFEVHTPYLEQIKKHSASTDDILHSLYDLARLTEEEKKLLINLALLPAENHTLALLAELLPGQNKNSLSRQLKRLAQKGLLNKQEHSYRLNPLAAAIIIEKNRERLVEEGKSLIEVLNKRLETDDVFLKHLTFAEARPVALLANSVAGHLNEVGFEAALLTRNIGRYYWFSGNFNQAIYWLQKARRAFENIDKENYSICIRWLAEIFQQQGDFIQALSFFQLDLSLTKELYEANPQSESLKNGLAISYSKLGSIFQQQGDFNQALSFFQLQNTLAKQLYEANPQSKALKNGLAISYKKLGDIFQQQGDLKKAHELFELEVKLFEELYEANPQSETLKNGLAISYSKLGSIFQQQGDLNQALSFFQLFNRLMKELYEANPQSETLKNGLAIAYEKLGDIFQQQGDFNQALSFFQLRSQLGKELYEANPQSVGLYNGLAVSYSKLAWLYLEMKEPEKARPLLEKCETIWVDLVEQVGIPEYQNNLDWARNSLKDLG